MTSVITTSILCLALVGSGNVPLVVHRANSSFTATVEQNQAGMSDEVKSLLAAADSGDSKAQLALGRKYLSGTDVVQDDGASLWWFRKAADQGLPEAEFAVGAAYAAGRGVVQDDAEAYQWFRKGAQHGFAPAQSNVGIALASGRGVQQDDRQAYQWFRKAAEQGDAEAQFWVGQAFHTGAAGAIDLALAMRWWRAAAEQGFAEAQLVLAQRYRFGSTGTGGDPFEAYKWLVICGAQSSEVQAQCAIGRDALRGYFGADQLADAERRAREWMVAFEHRQHQKQ